MEIYFIVCPGWGIEQISVLNVNSKNWNLTDYLNLHAKSGNKNYIRMKRFIAGYNFSLNVMRAIVTNRTTMRGSQANHKFKKGEFVFTENMEDAAKVRIKKIMELGQFHPLGSARTNFVASVICLMRTEGYDHKRMLIHMRSYPSKVDVLRDATDMQITGYLKVFSDVYNHRKRAGNRIDFLREFELLK